MSKQELSQAEMVFAEELVSLAGHKRQGRGEHCPPRGPRLTVDYSGGESA